MSYQRLELDTRTKFIEFFVWPSWNWIASAELNENWIQVDEITCTTIDLEQTKFRFQKNAISKWNIEQKLAKTIFNSVETILCILCASLMLVLKQHCLNTNRLCMKCCHFFTLRKITQSPNKRTFFSHFCQRTVYFKSLIVSFHSTMFCPFFTE